jgi:hypothetical protein
MILVTFPASDSTKATNRYGNFVSIDKLHVREGAVTGAITIEALYSTGTPCCGLALTEADARKLVEAIETLLDADESTTYLDRVEGLANGVARLHAPHYGYADVTAQFHPESKQWTYQVERTTIQNPVVLQRLINEYRRLEEAG